MQNFTDCSRLTTLKYYSQSNYIQPYRDKTVSSYTQKLCSVELKSEICKKGKKKEEEERLHADMNLGNRTIVTRHPL